METVIDRKGVIMKLLHINCNYLGTTLHQCMVEHLDACGVASTVFVPTYNPENSTITPNENVLVSKCFRKWDRIFFYHKQSKIQRALETAVEVGDYDLLHAYTLFTDGNCAYKLAKKYGVDYVVAIRNTDVNDFFKWRPHLIRRGIRIMEKAKAIFFLSESYKQQVLQKYIPARYRESFSAKSFIMPNGIDDFWLENCREDVDRELGVPLRLVYAGRIDGNKNIATTQAAMKKLSERGCEAHLTVVGKVADEKIYRQISAHPSTTCIPPKSKEDLLGIYRENDIFVMPSFTESFGLVYAEAISQGLPVVYSIGQGFDKQFSEGEVGYHADAYSADSVADSILKIVENYSRITTNISNKSKKYSWASICSQYCHIYQSLIQK